MNYKLILASLALLSANNLLSRPNDKVIGSITEQECKDFIIGAGFGVVHGAVNKNVLPHNDSMHIFSFTATHGLNYALQGIPASEAHLWGHGIGQMFAESYNPQTRNFDKVSLSINATTMIAIWAKLMSVVR